MPKHADQAPVPLLEDLEPEPVTPSTPARPRIAAAIVALLLTSASFALATDLFRRMGSQPAAAIGNGKIAFVALGRETWQLFTVEPDGTGLIQLTDVAPPLVVSGPAWSPDGSRLAYVVRESATDRSDIWVMNVDGSDAHPITDGRGSHWGPAWSPDGSRIAFTHGNDIHVMDADGMNVTNLMPERIGPSALDPAWSPDGESIAFVGRETDDDLYVMHSDGGGVRSLFGGPGAQREPAWSPDGSTIAFADHTKATESEVGEFTLIEPTGTVVDRLSNLPQVAQAPAWSPDGRLIVFMANVAGADRESIYVMSADGTAIREIRDLPGGASWPAWQPVFAEATPPRPVAVLNGQIAVAQGPDADIVLLDPETGTSTPLIERHQGGNEGGLQITWSPDGSKLAYTDYRANDAIGLFVLELSAGDVIDVSGGLANADSPAWSPDGTRIAFTGCECASGYEIYVVGADGEGLRTVTDEPDDGVSGAHMPAWSPDGTRIAYAVARYDAATETERSGIAIVDLETNEETIVTDTSEVDQSPAWSPDGTRIAFLRNVTGTAQVFVANADGTGERLIVRDDVDHIVMSPPLWSPDGVNVLFGAHIDDWGIWLANADGSGARAIIEDAFAAGPVWAPDGSLIAFVGDDSGRPLPDVAIRLIRPDGSEDRKLAAMENVSELAWQPVFAEQTAPSPSPSMSPARGSISAIDAVLPEGRLLVQVDDQVELLEEGDETSRLIGQDLFALDLSPDGSRALVSTPWDSVGPETALVSLDLTSGERTPIAELGSWGIPARWSPDGSSVAVRVGERNLLCVHDLAIEEPRCLPELGRVYKFDWSPDGTRIVFEQGLPGSLTVLDVASGQTSVMVRWDDPEVLDAVAAAGLGEASDVQFQGPRWSPSGRYVAALGMMRTDEGHANMVLVFDLDGSVVARGVPFHEFSEARGWSPTADVFGYASGEPPYRIVEARLLDVSTDEDRLLFPTSDSARQTIHSLVWSPSGRWIAVVLGDVSDGWFVSEIQILDTTGADPPRIFETSAAFPELVEWGP